MRAFIVVFVGYLVLGFVGQAHAYDSPQHPEGLRPPAIIEIVCPTWKEQCCIINEEGRFCLDPQALTYFIRTVPNATEDMCQGPLCHRDGRLVGLSPYYPFYPNMH